MRKFRLYAFTLYQLSPIQKGIQAWHAGEEYLENVATDEERQYRKNDKTVVILNGGTTLTMDVLMNSLDEMGINYAIFREPDLGNIITAISIMVDDRVYDKTSYPDYKYDRKSNLDYFAYQLFSHAKDTNPYLTIEQIRFRDFLFKYNLAS